MSIISDIVSIISAIISIINANIISITPTLCTIIRKTLADKALKITFKACIICTIEGPSKSIKISKCIITND